MKASVRGRSAVVASVCGGFFVLFALPRLFQIAGQDEILHYVALGERLHREGFAHADSLITFSPHLYGFCIALAHGIFGPGVWVARLPGLPAWLLAGWGVWGWVRRELPDGGRSASAAAVALLASLPLAVQGAAVVDIDNTVLVPAVLFLCLAVDRFVVRPSLGAGLALAVCMALALWCRLTTPTLLLPVFVLYGWLRLRRFPPCLGLLAGLGGGIVLFLGTWWLYCLVTGVSVAGPFAYLVESLRFCTVGEDRGIRPGKVFLTGVYTLCWLGIPVVFLVLGAVLARVRRVLRGAPLAAADLLLLGGMAVVGGYCAVGGTIFGFPKYHCPGVLLLLAGTAMAFGRDLLPASRRDGFLAFGLVLGGATLQVCLLRDPLLLLRLPVRRLLLRGESPAALLLGGLALPLLTACLVVAALAFAAWRNRLARVPLVLAALGLGMNLGLLLLQQSGGYQTGYNYGDQGDARTVAAFLDGFLAEGDTAIAPGEIVHLLEHPGVRHVHNDLWTDRAGLEAALQRSEVRAATASILTNTVLQVRTLIEVAAADPGFQRCDIGDYAVFLRLPPTSPHSRAVRDASSALDGALARARSSGNTYR
ncbi:MAG: glycosyltransferase family 39 protein [Lentisphaeria bacterium]|nr:glycosyltransferase family 39 protein [Lentisphaeria bacterium]